MPFLLLLALAANGVEDAIRQAAEARLGTGQAVVRNVSTRVVDRPGLTAAPEPGARVGKPARFVIFRNGERIGSAVATLEVESVVVRARRPLDRDDVIEAADVEATIATLQDVALRRLPTLEQVIGLRPRRDVAAGEILTSTTVTLAPAVRSGDTVRVIVTMGQVQATGVGRASGSGHVGDVIRVFAPSSRKPRRARITAPGVVEIVS